MGYRGSGSNNSFFRDIANQFMNDPRFGGNPNDTKEAREAYKEASGIDIQEQKEIWDERAKGYWGEYKVFSKLFRELDFPNKLMVNVQIPAENGKTTEIDLLLFASTGVYVFEIKNYCGAVYGSFDKPTWTEYFKTRDSVTFENPLKQNAYHLRQLKSLLPDAKLYSYVVFTNPDAKIMVGGRYPGYLTVCDINGLTEKIRGDFAGREEVYSYEQITDMFRKVMPYSPMENNKDDFFQYGEKILPFSSFAETIIKELEREKQKVLASADAEIKRKEAELEDQRIAIQKEADAEVERRTAAIKRERIEIEKTKSNCIAQIAEAEKKQAEAEEKRDEAVKSFEAFAQNFDNVKPFTSKYGVLNRECFKADVKFEMSDSFVDTVNMYYTLKNMSKEIWIETLNAWLIVGLKDGRVQKYVFGEHRAYYHNGSKIQPMYSQYDSPRKIRLFDIASIEDIKYIKMCNAAVFTGVNERTNVAPGVEFELYVADDSDSVYSMGEEKKVAALNGGRFELKPDFIKSEIEVIPSASGTGSDICFSFAACTGEVGVDLTNAAFVILTNSCETVELGIKANTKNFYSTSIMPLSKTSKFSMHTELSAGDIAIIKLKGARIFRKENWLYDNIMPDAVFDVYPQG